MCVAVRSHSKKTGASPTGEKARARHSARTTPLRRRRHRQGTGSSERDRQLGHAPRLPEGAGGRIPSRLGARPEERAASEPRRGEGRRGRQAFGRAECEREPGGRGCEVSRAHRSPLCGAGHREAPKSGASERASEGSSMWVAQSSRPKIATSIARGVHAAARRQEIERGMERSGVRALQLQETNNNLAAVEARARTWHFSTSVDHQRERERAMVAEKVRQKRATAQERQWVLEHVGVAAVTEVQSHGGGNDHNAHSNAARLHLNQRPRPRCHSARCSKVRVLGEFVGGGPEAEKGEA